MRRGRARHVDRHYRDEVRGVDHAVDPREGTISQSCVQIVRRKLTRTGYTASVGQLDGRSMDHFDLAQGFVERCALGEPPMQLCARYASTLAALGFRYFACCSRADPGAGALRLHNYPRVWIDVVIAARLYENDPVLRYAETACTPFSWNDARFRRSLDGQQRRIMAAAAARGLVGGCTIPLRFDRRPRAWRASCSIVPDRGPLETWRYRMAGQLGVLLYAATLCVMTCMSSRERSGRCACRKDSASASNLWHEAIPIGRRAGL